MKPKTKAFALPLALSLASTAHGSTFVQSIALASVAVPGGVVVQGQGSPLAQFNPSLGTLQSVTLSLENQVYYFPNPTTNSNQTSASYTLGGHFTDTVVIGGIQLAFSYDPLETGVLFGGEFRMVGIGGSKSADTTIYSNFGALVGTGTVTPLSFMTGLITTYSVDAGVQLLLAPNAQYVSNGTLTYNYAAPGEAGVPEPASWALMIAGLGFTGIAMRRRRVTAVALAPAIRRAR